MRKASRIVLLVLALTALAVGMSGATVLAGQVGPGTNAVAGQPGPWHE
jgi:flagellar basal body-associated protein FliL